MRGVCSLGSRSFVLVQSLVVGWFQVQSCWCWLEKWGHVQSWRDIAFYFSSLNFFSAFICCVFFVLIWTYEAWKHKREIHTSIKERDHVCVVRFHMPSARHFLSSILQRISDFHQEIEKQGWFVLRLAWLHYWMSPMPCWIQCDRFLLQRILLISFYQYALEL